MAKRWRASRLQILSPPGIKPLSAPTHPWLRQRQNQSGDSKDRQLPSRCPKSKAGTTPMPTTGDRSS